MDKRLSVVCDVACNLAMIDEKGEYVHEYDEARHKALVSWGAAKHGVQAKMVDPSGPGGGHPTYRFTGTRAQQR